jgi:hypothetical protein
MKPSAFRIERLLAKVEAEVARRGLRARRYAFHPDEVAEAEAQGLPYALVPRVLSKQEWLERYATPGAEAEFYARFSGGPVTRPDQPVAPATPKPSAPGPQQVKSAQTAAAAPWSQQEHQPNTRWPDASYGDGHKGGDGFFSVEVHRSSQSNDPPT